MTGRDAVGLCDGCPGFRSTGVRSVLHVRRQRPDGQGRLRSACMAEPGGSLLLQSPGGGHRTAQFVLLCHALAVEVQPPGALEGNLAGCRILLAAGLRHQPEGVAVPHLPGRQMFPGRRHMGLLGIHRPNTFHLHHVQVVVIDPRPYFRIRCIGRQFQFRGRRHLQRLHLQMPGAGPQLCLQPSIRIEPGGNVTGEPLGHRAGQQCGGQIHLARQTGHVQLEMRGDAARDGVVDAPANEGGQRIADGLRRTGAAPLLQPHALVGIQHGLHGLSIGRDRQQPCLWRYPHQLRRMRKGDLPAQDMLAGGQPHPGDERSPGGMVLRSTATRRSTTACRRTADGCDGQLLSTLVAYLHRPAAGLAGQ